MSGDAPADAVAALEVLRARGAARLDPVRFRALEALVPRVATLQGRARDRLQERLARWLADCTWAVERAATRPVPGPGCGPLAALVADLDPAGIDAPAVAAPAPRPPAELRAVRDHRQAWAQLGVERRLLQALAQVPGQAGPLNTQRLLHQALRAMRDTSPGYLQHFVLHVEALLWLDAAGLPPVAAPGASAAPQPRRRRHARPGGQQ